MHSEMALEILKLAEDGSGVVVKLKQEAAAFLQEDFTKAKEAKAALKEIKEAKTPVKANIKTKTKAKAKGDSND